MDRLSDLPDLAIERILEGLPLIDRARTSALSSGWRLRWAKLPFLAFTRESYRSFCNGEHRLAAVNYLMTIEYIVKQHIGPLREFTLYLPPTAHSVDIHGGFHPLIKFVLRKGVENLYVYNSGTSHIGWPSSLFSSTRLTHLKIRNCRFDWPHSFGFPNLISLDLDNPDCEPHIISGFISSCTNLQTVTLVDLRFGGEEFWLDVPQLLHLSVEGTYKCLFLEYNQKLVSLGIKGSFELISLKNAPNLEKLSVCQPSVYDCQEDEFDEIEELPQYVVSNFFEGMPKLQRIKIGGYFCHFLANGSVPFQSPRFDHVVTLNFEKLCLCTCDEVRCMYSLVESCPNLKELYITMDFLTMSDAAQMSLESEISEYSRCAFQHLVRVHIEVLGTRTEMKMIEVLLGCSPILEVMSIRLTGKYTMPSGGDRKLKVLEKVIRYCRASAKAKVVFLKKNEGLSQALAR